MGVFSRKVSDSHKCTQPPLSRATLVHCPWVYTSLRDESAHHHTHTLAPSAPTIVYVEATSSTSISVYWESSENDGGSPITGYMVEYSPTSNPSFETQVVPRDVFSTSLDGLTRSTEYDVRVRGENGVGRSVPSAIKTARTDGELIQRLLPGVCVD